MFIGERPEFVDFQFPVEDICVYACTHFVPDSCFSGFTDSCRGTQLSIRGCWQYLEVRGPVPPNTADVGRTIYGLVRVSYNTV